MASKLNFPLKIQRLTKEETAEAFKDVQGGYMKYYIRVGPHGYFFSDPFEELLPKIYNLELRTDDVLIITFPKAGSNWAQELVWLVANDFDYETARSVPLVERFPLLEYSIYYHNDVAKALIKRACEDESKLEIAAKLKLRADDGPTAAAKMKSPRFLKSHQPFSILPPGILEKTKVVYIARDPRDIAVSYFHHDRAMLVNGYKGQFKDFWELFKKNMVLYCPFFAHFKEAWALKGHHNMLFLFYEELSKDLPDVIRRVAKFLDKTVTTEEQIAELCEHLKFDNFRYNPMVNYDIFKQLGLFAKDDHFVRKGKVGGWRDYFDEEMAKDAERWMEEELRGIDFTFQS